MKNFLNYFILLAIFTSAPLFLQAQENRAGYIVKNSGDTVFGILQYQRGKNASQECKFQKDEFTKPETYKPGEIFGYRFQEGKYFISKEMPVNGQDYLLFAEFLIQGIANMYYVNYQNTDHYYIETEKDGLIELTEPERIVMTDSGTFVLPPRYKGLLGFILSDYDRVNEDVKYMDLDHKSLIKLGRDYHYAVCDSIQCIIFEKKVAKLHLNFGIQAGYTTSRYNFGNMLDSDFGSGYTLGASLILNNFVVSNERLSLQLGVLFHKHYGNIFKTGKSSEFGEYVNYEDEKYFINRTKIDTSFGFYTYVTSLNAKLNVLALKIPVTFNYTSLSTKLRPYFGLGLEMMFVLSQNQEFDYTFFKKIYGKSVPGFLFGLKGNAGISKPFSNNTALFFEVTYDYLLAYNINNFLRLHVSSFSFLAGFRF